MTAELADVVARVLGIAAAEVSDESGPKTTGAWTSLKHLQLIAAIEDTYQVKFTPREIRSARTVGSLRAAVQQKAGQD